MFRRWMVVLIAVILTLSCGSEKVIKQEEKPAVTTASWAGRAKIVSIGRQGDSYSREKDYVEVRFDFIPDDPAAPGKYLSCDDGDKNILLFYDNRYDLHKNWIFKWGLKVGNEYRAIRHENIKNSPGHRTEFVVTLEPR